MSVGFVHNNAYEKTAGNGVTMLGLPDWSQAEAVTAAQLAAGYTAPANGIICIAYAQVPSQGGNGSITINNVVVGYAYYVASTDIRPFEGLSLPVSAGDVAKSFTTLNSVMANFVPFKTA